MKPARLLSSLKPLGRSRAEALLLGPLCVLLLGAAPTVTYMDGLKAALANNQISECTKINMGGARDDVGVSVEAAQDNCRVAFITTSGLAADCLMLRKNREFPAEVTPQRECLDQMAQKYLSPDICEMIPEEDESAEESLSYARCKILSLMSTRACVANDPVMQQHLAKDNCREASLGTRSACLEGFYDKGTARRLADPSQCTLAVALHTRDVALCSQDLDQQKAKLCVTMVENEVKARDSRQPYPSSTIGP